MSLFNYECDEVKRIIEEVSPNYPQLTTYEKEWIYFYKYGYIPGIPVDLEYQEVIVNPTGTAQNAIPYPYKRAILKGNTLVNLLNKLTVNGEVGQTTNWYTTTYTTGTVKSGTYILLYHVKETSGTMTRNTPGIRLADGTYLYHGYEDINTTTGIKKWIFTANEDLSEFGYWLTYNTGKVVVEDFILLEYQEGMENWDIPSFEGMQSVQKPVLTITNEEGTETNILTVNEEVELGSVGEVKDELDLLTGKITQRTDIRPYQESDESDSEVLTDMTNTRYKLAQEVVKTVDLTKLDKPYEGANHYHLTVNIPCEAILEVPVVSTGEQTLQEINND